MRRRRFLKTAGCAGLAGGLLPVVSGLNRGQKTTHSGSNDSSGTDDEDRRLVNGAYRLRYTWSDEQDRLWTFRHTLDREAYESARRRPGGLFVSFEKAKSSPYGKKISRDLVDSASSSSTSPGLPLTPTERLDMAVSFVQSFDYARDRDSKGIYDYHRTIEETLVEGVTDCKDATYLLAGILSNPPFDYRTAMVISESDTTVGHMYLGVHREDLPGPYHSAQTLPGGTYVPIESIQSMPVGERPEYEVLAVYDGSLHYLDTDSIFQLFRDWMTGQDRS